MFRAVWSRTLIGKHLWVYFGINCFHFSIKCKLKYISQMNPSSLSYPMKQNNLHATTNNIKQPCLKFPSPTAVAPIHSLISALAQYSFFFALITLSKTSWQFSSLNFSGSWFLNHDVYNDIHAQFVRHNVLSLLLFDGSFWASSSFRQIRQDWGFAFCVRENHTHWQEGAPLHHCRQDQCWRREIQLRCLLMAVGAVRFEMADHNMSLRT